MLNLTITTKSGRMITLHFHREETARRNDILVNFSDWCSLGAAADVIPVIDCTRGTKRIVIPFASIEALEVA